MICVKLLEARTAPLYHSCSLKGFINIINTDTLGLEGSYVSLTRSLVFAKKYKYNKAAKNGSCRVILILDQDKLSKNIKLVPVGDNYSFARGTNMMKARYVGSDLAKAEERVMHPIKNITKYITGFILQEEIKDFANHDELVKILSKNISSNITYF